YQSCACIVSQLALIISALCAFFFCSSLAGQCFQWCSFVFARLLGLVCHDVTIVSGYYVQGVAVY
ncbi:unnamed protein product, partial [Callosobruchus maculatus]